MLTDGVPPTYTKLSQLYEVTNIINTIMENFTTQTFVHISVEFCDGAQNYLFIGNNSSW